MVVAVVSREDDERVVQFALLLQLSQNATTCGIDLCYQTNGREVFAKVCCFMIVIREKYGGIENTFTTASYTLISHDETHAAWLPVQGDRDA